MNSRERVLASLNHKQPDKMAIDFGGICNSTMNVNCIEQLRDYYGLEKRPVKTIDVFSMAGLIEDDLAEAMGVDCAPAYPNGSLFGFKKDKWKEWKNPLGQTILVPEGFNPEPDGKGGLLVRPHGDPTAAPSGRMAEGCVYFEALLRNTEFDEDEMDPHDNVDEDYKLIDDEGLKFLKNAIDEAYETGRAVVLAMPGMGLADAAETPGCGIKEPKGIRDYADWYMAPMLYPEYVSEVFRMQTDIAIENMKRIKEIAEDKIDVIFTCAADQAHQESLFMSPDVFREIYAPHYIRANAWIHENTRWKILKHCCGACEPLIGDYIECGFDALNPVQCSARGMDPKHLKDTYGANITFWGGGVDTQHVLPFGTPEQVREQALERCEIFAKDGGYIFNAIHNIQYGTPIENIVALINAAHEFNGDL